MHSQSGKMVAPQCGNSSVGRAQPCQGWGREFESRFPLKRRKAVQTGCFFRLTRDLHEATPLTPFRGWGCKYNSREMPANAGSWLVFPSKSKSFEDKIKQNPLKHRFRGFFICCRSVSFRLREAPTRQSPNHEVPLRISTVKIRDTYSEMRGHFDNFSAFYKLFNWQLPTL